MRGFRQDHRSNSPDRAVHIRGEVADGRLVRHGVGVLLAALTLMPGIAHAAVINVPADHATIQAAIAAAVSGADEVVVAPGTYLEAIDFLGKAITLRSSGGAAVTTIDGNGAFHVVQCVSGETSATVLDGFTITGGNANGGVFPDNDGGGMRNANSSPTVTNCTFSGNSAFFNGGGMYNEFSSPTVTNCILWGDSPDEIFNNSSTPTIAYSDVQGSGGSGAWDVLFGTDGGGNIDVDPLIVPQLLPGSPCLDAGDNTAVPGGITTDLAGNPRFVDDPAADTGNGTPPIVDMGAYEGPLNCDFSGGDLYVATCGHDANSGAGATCGAGGAKQTIQAAINAAAATNVIIVAPGTYPEKIDFLGKEITVRSACGATLTTIDGNGAFHVVQCVSGETSATVLDGFTITGGNANGGVFPDNDGGGMRNANSSPTVTNCTFSGNSAFFNGGGMYNVFSSPTVTNCTFKRE